MSLSMGPQKIKYIIPHDGFDSMFGMVCLSKTQKWFYPNVYSRQKSLDIVLYGYMYIYVCTPTIHTHTYINTHTHSITLKLYILYMQHAHIQSYILHTHTQTKSHIYTTQNMHTQLLIHSHTSTYWTVYK